MRRGRPFHDPDLLFPATDREFKLARIYFGVPTKTGARYADFFLVKGFFFSIVFSNSPREIEEETGPEVHRVVIYRDPMKPVPHRRAGFLRERPETLSVTEATAKRLGGSLEAAHISSPLRTSLRRTAVIRGRVTGIDFEQRRVHLAGGARVPGSVTDTAKNGEGLGYEQLVLALGAVSSYVGLCDVQAVAFELKSLADAVRIRHHVIDMFVNRPKAT
jgi:hypothetical protein